MRYSTKKKLLNHQIFMEKLIADKDFFLEIQNWYLGLRVTKENLGYFYEKRPGAHVKAHELGIQLWEKAIKEKNVEFIHWLDSFCKKHKLGEVWKPTLINYVACGYFCPPDSAFNIFTDTTENVVVLKLEADVDKEDIMAGWPKIKEALKQLPPKKKRRFSKQSFDNFERLLWKNKFKKSEGLKGLDLIGRIYEDMNNEENEIPSVETDKKLLKKMKIITKRTKRRGYNK